MGTLQWPNHQTNLKKRTFRLIQVNFPCGIDISKFGLCSLWSLLYRGSVICRQLNTLSRVGWKKYARFANARLRRDLPQAGLIVYKTFFLRPRTRNLNSLASDVSSCKSSFLYASIFFRSFSICCQHRTRGWVELWVVPRKRNWRSSRIPWNAVCCPTVCIYPNLACGNITHSYPALLKKRWRPPICYGGTTPQIHRSPPSY